MGVIRVVQRERVAAFALVVAGHLAMGWFLAKAMRLPVLPPSASDEVVMYLEFLPPPTPDDIEVIEDVVEPDVQAPVPAPPVAPSAPRRESPSMQAIFVPAVPDAAPPDASPREFVAPERDPFHRPATPERDRFGRSPPAATGNPALPRIAGERPIDAPIPELRATEPFGPKRLIEVAGALIGGGRNAPVEAPCGGRINGDVVGDTAFSPNWRRDYGCGDEKDSAGFTGKVELPPGTAR